MAQKWEQVVCTVCVAKITMPSVALHCHAQLTRHPRQNRQRKYACWDVMHAAIIGTADSGTMAHHLHGGPITTVNVAWDPQVCRRSNRKSSRHVKIFAPIRPCQHPQQSRPPHQRLHRPQLHHPDATQAKWVTIGKENCKVQESSSQTLIRSVTMMRIHNGITMVKAQKSDTASGASHVMIKN